MGALDQIMDMRSKRIPDQEIIRRLQEQGIPPMEISDAFARAQIKNAVSMGGTEGMEHSIMNTEEEPERLPVEGLEGGTLSDVDLTPPIPSTYLQQLPSHVTKEIAEQQAPEMYEPKEAPTYYQPQQPQYYPTQQQYSPPQQTQSFPQEDYQYSPVSVTDTDTMMEVAEQVFMEKNKSFQKRVDEMNEFRVIAQAKIDNISDRLRKIEAVIDRLQASILEKVGSYGNGLDVVKKEMNMMQDSFSKMVGNIADKSEHHHEQHSHSQQPVHHTIHHKKTTVIHHKSKKKISRKK